MASYAADEFVLVGNHPALDLVNTELRTGAGRVDLLRDVRSVVRWLVAVGLFSEADAARVPAVWLKGAAAARFLEELKELRRSLRRLAEDLAAGRPVPAEVVKGIDRVLASRSGRMRLRPCEKGHALSFEPDAGHAVQTLLAPIAQSAAELLADGELALIKSCENPDCVLVFYDTTKNHGRHWCSMTACGNRAKAARHYRRVRADAKVT